MSEEQTLEEVVKEAAEKAVKEAVEEAVTKVAEEQAAPDISNEALFALVVALTARVEALEAK